MVSCWGVTKHIQSKSMTTHRTDPELLNTILQLLTDQGATGGLAEGIRLLVNEAMRQERSQALQAQPGPHAAVIRSRMGDQPRGHQFHR